LRLFQAISSRSNICGFASGVISTDSTRADIIDRLREVELYIKRTVGVRNIYTYYILFKSTCFYSSSIQLHSNHGIRLDKDKHQMLIPYI